MARSRASELLNMSRGALARLVLRNEFPALSAQHIAELIPNDDEQESKKKKQKPNNNQKPSLALRILENQSKFDFANAKYRRIALKVAYFGKNYFGVPFQKSSPETIQQKILDALHTTCLVPAVEVSKFDLQWTLCGRTDKGVNAFGNVVILNVRSRLSDEQKEEFDYCRVLNNVLPSDIRILGWAAADQPVIDTRSNEARPMNARLDCARRSYKYLIFNDGLDLQAMKKAGDLLVGEHDFRNLCKIDLSSTTHFRRRILSVEIDPLIPYRGEDGDDQMFVVTITGYAFLYHQIRCIMSILLFIGRGLEQPELISALLDVEANPRKPDYVLADEMPLVLWDCSFPQLEFSISSDAANRLFHEWKCHWRRLHMESSLWWLAIHELSKTTPPQEKRAPVFQLMPFARTKHIPVLKRSKGPTLEELALKMGKLTDNHDSFDE